MTEETAQARESNDACVIRGSGIGEKAEAHGRYEVECRGSDGRVKWHETIDNIVCTVGKNLMLDTALAGAAYTTTGPFMALSYGITSTGTVKGAFVVYGAGAVATKDDTGGVLWSTGTFTTGDKAVSNGDTLNISYSTSL